MTDGPLPLSPRTVPSKGSTDGQSVRLVSLPEGLQNTARALRLDGEVVRQNQDGSVRIRTVEGVVDIEVRGRQPQSGQRVEIDIPAGRPPRQATFRDAPTRSPDTQSPQQSSQQPTRQDAQIQSAHIRAQKAVQSQTPQPATTQSQTNQTSTQTTNAPNRPVPQAPLSPDLTQTIKTHTSSAPPQNSAAPLQSGQTVRLLPLPLAQAGQPLLQTGPVPQTPVITTVTRTAFQASLTAQNVQSDLNNALLTIQKPEGLNAALLKTAQPAAFLTRPAFTAPQTQANTPSPLNLFLTQGAAIPTNPTAQQNPAYQTNLSFIPNTQTVGQSQQNIATPTLLFSPQNAVPSQPPSFTANIVKIDGIVQSIAQAPVRLIPVPQGNAPSPLQIQQPSSLNPVITAQASPQTLTAQVTSFSPQGLPIVSLQLPQYPAPQNFILQYAASNLQIGSTIQLAPQTLSGVPATQALPSLQTSLPLPQAIQNWQWSTLEQLYQTLQQSAPQAAQALARTLPNAANAAGIPPAALLFIAAARAGDLAQILGDKKIELLERLGGKSLLSRLTGDSAPLARAAGGEPVSGEWRAIPLPMFWQDAIHKITLYTRRDDAQDQQDQNGGEQQTRFLFDLSLNRMGDVQIDGLMRGQRLDVIVRTHHPFSLPMQQAMRKAYADALGDTAIYGEISFQGDPRQWVHVFEKEEGFGVEA